MPIFVNWLIALCVVLLFFAGFYFIVKLAVKSAMREIINAFGREMAKKLWAEDDTQPTQESQEPQEPQD